MTGIYNHAMELYPLIFQDYLSVHVVIRLIGFLFLAVAISLIACKLVVPLMLRFLGPLLVHAWNFAITETLYEFLFIHFLSDPSKKMFGFIKNWHAWLGNKIWDHLFYIDAPPSDVFKWGGVSEEDKGMLKNHRKLENQRFLKRFSLMINLCLFLSVVAFSSATILYDFQYLAATQTVVLPQIELPSFGDSAEQEKSTEVFYSLNKGVVAGNIRSLPALEGSNVIEQVGEEVQLLYLREQSPDPSEDGIVWFKILTPAGQEGWISGRIVSIVE